ncbi:MAG: hypothetical protein HYU66_21435 [Armatimonadetes bacterium]|nr:hypothetical protein [Armatimonadota bacterium]
MRVPRAGVTWLARLVWGDEPETPRRPEVGRWLRSRSGAVAVCERCARVLVGFALRAGGALAEPVFDGDGQPLGERPLWDPVVRARSDWRLSGGAAEWLAWLWRRASEPESEQAAPRPATAADLLLCHAVASGLDERVASGERWLADAAAGGDPLSAVAAFDREAPGEARLAALQPWCEADWLQPYLRGWLCRRWLALDAGRRLMAPQDEVRLNERAAAVWWWLYRAWERRPQTEHLALFAEFYARWLRVRGGVQTVLREIRNRPWSGPRVSAREAYEESHGRLLEPALALCDLVGELRGLGWQRTPAQDYLVGCYSRELAPLIDALRGLRDELCRIV